MRRAALWLVPALAAVLSTAACGSASHEGSFDAQPSTASPTCLAHQTATPGKRYTGGEDSDPMSVLELMRFYTANGTKAYCDGGPPTATDKRWTTLYVTLGGDPGRLRH